MEDPAAAPPPAPSPYAQLFTLKGCLAVGFTLMLITVGTLFLAWRSLTRHWWDGPPPKIAGYHQAEAEANYKNAGKELKWGQKDKAMRYFNGALKLYEADKAYLPAVAVLCDMAWADQVDHPRDSLARFREALQVLKMHPDPTLEAKVKVGLAYNLLASSKGLDGSAIRYLEEARLTYGKQRSKGVVAQIDNDLIYPEMVHRNYSDAVWYASEARRLFHDLGNPQDERKAQLKEEALIKQGAKMPEVQAPVPYEDLAE